MTIESRVKRYKALCREAAKRLGCKASDDRVQHAATLLLAREQCLARMISGRDIDPSALLKLDESLKQFMPPADPLNLTIEIVGPSNTRCPRCGHEFDPETPERTKMLPPLEPSPPPAVAKPEAPPEPAPSAENVVPIRRSIHDAPGSLARPSQDTLMGGFKPPGA